MRSPFVSAQDEEKNFEFRIENLEHIRATTRGCPYVSIDYPWDKLIILDSCFLLTLFEW
jgi:hypothetical protein